MYLPTQKNNKMRALLRLLACCTLLAPVAYADETLRWLDQQRRERDGLEREERLRQLQRQVQAAPQGRPPEADDGSNRCWPLPGVRLSGNHLISDAALRQRLAPYVRPCLSVDAIRHMLAAITRAYVQRGYIAARAYPAAPPAAGEPLEITVDEGFVESIELNDDSLPVSLKGAFPDMVGRPLHLPALEQGLDQLNRLRSIDLQAQIAPGELAGGSRILLVQRAHHSRWGLGVRYGNGGDVVTGRHGLSLVASHDNPLHVNDVLHVSLFRSVGAAPNHASGVGLYYSVPYGPWTLGASLARSQQVAFAPVSHTRSEAVGTSESLSLNRTVWRDQHTLVGASLRLTRKSQERWIAGRRYTRADDHLTSASLDLNVLWLGRATWSGQLGYDHGLPWFNATARSHQRWRAAVMRTRQWPVPGRLWRWDSSLEAQYSPNPLPASEQALLSSPNSVRGFRDSNIAASSALVWRNSLGVTLPLGRGLALTPQVGLDYGRGWGTYTREHQYPALAALSGGASLGWPGGELKLEYRHAMVIKDGPSSEPGFWNTELKLDF